MRRPSLIAIGKAHNRRILGLHILRVFCMKPKRTKTLLVLVRNVPELSTVNLASQFRRPKCDEIISDTVHIGTVRL